MAGTLSVTLIAISVFVVLGCQKESGEVVAQVGKSKLTMEYLQEGVPKEFSGMISRNQYLDMVARWVDQEALFQQAVSAGLHKEQEYLRLVEQSRKKILVDRWMQRELTQKRNVSESEVQSYFSKNRQKFLRKKTVYSYKILNARDLHHGWAIRAQVSKVGFDKHAEFQDKKGNPPQSFEFRTRSEIPLCMRDFVSSTKVKTTTVPVRCPSGIKVLHVTERIVAGTKLPLKNVYKKVVEKVKREKVKMVAQKITDHAKNKRPILTFLERIPQDSLLSVVW